MGIMDGLKSIVVLREILVNIASIATSLNKLANQGEINLRIKRLQSGLVTEEDLLNAEKSENASVLMQTDEELSKLEELEEKATTAGRRPAIDEMPIDPFDFS